MASRAPGAARNRGLSAALAGWAEGRGRRGGCAVRAERKGTTGPAILRGGEGADEFRLAEDFVCNADGEVDLRMRAGILPATLTGRAGRNVHLFDPAVLGLPEEFDRPRIDAVILNPDPEDRLFLGDEQHSVVMGSCRAGDDPASTLDYLRVVSGDHQDGGRHRRHARPCRGSLTPALLPSRAIPPIRAPLHRRSAGRSGETSPAVHRLPRKG